MIKLHEQTIQPKALHVKQLFYLLLFVFQKTMKLFSLVFVENWPVP